MKKHIEFETVDEAFNVFQQFQTVGIVKFHHSSYGMVVLHHFDSNNGDEYSPYWEMADLIVCCHPELLPEWARVKHLMPQAVGVLQLGYFFNFLSVTSVTDKTEPVVLTKKQQKKLKQKNKK